MAETTDTQRLVLNVPKDFHRRLKVAAAAQGTDMRDIVITCVSECLDRRPEGFTYERPKMGASLVREQG